MKLFSLAEKYFTNPDSTYQISPHHIYSTELSFGFASSLDNGRETHIITRDLVTSLSYFRDGIQMNVVFNHGSPMRLRLLMEELPTYYSDYYEIHYIMDGTLCVEIEGKQVFFHAGELCVINSMAARRELLGQSDCLMLNILIDNPAQLGSDQAVDAVAAINQYSAPLIIIDMGTATTCSVINKDGAFLGGLICPGLKTSMNALIGNASQLSSFELGNPKEVVGTKTDASINSGVIFGHSEMINGLRKKVEAETNEKYKVILTGGNSDYVANYVDKDIIHDKNLIFYGLNELYKRK